MFFTFLLNLSHVSVYIFTIQYHKIFYWVLLQWKLQEMHGYSVCCFLYNTVDAEWFYKTSVSIFPMPHVRCKSIANEHTLLNRKRTQKTQLQNSVQRHTCTIICNKNCKEAPVSMCVCPDYGHGFINTYIATCRYRQYTVHADGMSYGKGFCKFSRTLVATSKFYVPECWHEAISLLRTDGH
jgi:hypothetical protein